MLPVVQAFRGAALLPCSTATALPCYPVTAPVGSAMMAASRKFAVRLAAALFLVLARYGYGASARLDAAQTRVLQDCEAAWSREDIVPFACLTLSVECDQSETNIISLSFPSMYLTGPLPPSIGTLTALTSLDLSGNGYLRGPIPSTFSRLSRLQVLDLSLNKLNGSLDAVKAMTSLRDLKLNGNNFKAILPPSFSTLTALTYIDLSYNKFITGHASQLLHLTHVKVLGLRGCSLTGIFPERIGQLTKLQTLSLSNLNGSLPTSLSRLVNLQDLSLTENFFTGSLPESLTILSNLERLKLRTSQLLGTLPSSLGSLTKLTHLDLSQNMFSGLLPASFGNLINLDYLILLSNDLSGTVPASLGFLAKLTYLELYGNAFSGFLPASLGNITTLETLYYPSTLACPSKGGACVVDQKNGTQFCKSCPDFCSSCSSPGLCSVCKTPVQTNTSRNSTASSPPTSPPSPPIPPSSSASSSSPSSATSDPGGLSAGAIAGIAAALLLLLLAAAGGVAWWWYRRKSLSTSKGVTGLLPGEVCREYPLAQVCRATGNWSEENLVGSGGFGDVYRGVSPDDGTTLWAVKRAKVITNDFHNEVTQMATKHHPNLVRLLGYSMGGNVRSRIEQVLIYEFVPNGDLLNWVGNDAPTPLTLQQRLDILIGSAHGFEYLHSFGIVHRDIKPANILLDDKMQAKIADFGLVRLGEGTTVGTTRVMGTPGFVDPAYSSAKMATWSADVYSFGVLMLVVLTGRNVTFKDDGEISSIVDWAEKHISNEDALSLGDPCMEAPGDVILRIAHMAISCTAKLTATRPSMARLANDLEAIRAEVVGEEVDRAALKVDEVVQQLNEGEKMRPLDEELSIVQGMVGGNTESTLGSQTGLEM
ncbi:hypothetical protein CLOM_g4607 [Closterium sp. NIES-68]|nr:hypothetical protein CLOM_g4607 [Closterium sp. NIES-68]